MVRLRRFGRKLPPAPLTMTRSEPFLIRKIQVTGEAPVLLRVKFFLFRDDFGFGQKDCDFGISCWRELAPPHRAKPARWGPGLKRHFRRTDCRGPSTPSHSPSTSSGSLAVAQDCAGWGANPVKGVLRLAALCHTNLEGHVAGRRAGPPRAK